MPTEEDDNDHANIATTSVAAATTSVGPAPTNAAPDAALTDVPNRPTKPTKSPSPGSDTQEAEPSESSAAPPSTWLPSFLPTFGVSAATQVWIYGSLVLIVLFCSGLGVYFWLARRKRMRQNPRNDYEFEMLREEEGEGLAGSGGAGGAVMGEKGGARGKRTKGGELYDAFAGGSDDDDDEFDGAGAGYRDQPSGSGSGSGSSLDRGIREKVRRDSEEEEHHVIGDSEDSGDEEERPLRS